MARVYIDGRRVLKNEVERAREQEMERVRSKG